jgi:hypothetical protein
MSYFDQQGIPKEGLRIQPQEEVRDRTVQESHRTRDKNGGIEEDVASEASGEDLFEDCSGPAAKLLVRVCRRARTDI